MIKWIYQLTIQQSNNIRGGPTKPEGDRRGGPTKQEGDRKGGPTKQEGDRRGGRIAIPRFSPALAPSRLPRSRRRREPVEIPC